MQKDITWQEIVMKDRLRSYLLEIYAKEFGYCFQRVGGMENV